MMQSRTPRTEKFFDKVQPTLAPEDFANPWAQARVIAEIDRMLLACRLFSRRLERELIEELRK